MTAFARPARSFTVRCLRGIGLGVLAIAGLGSIVATGGGGGDSPPGSASPRLTGLTLADATLPFLAGGGRAISEATVTWTDPQADIATIRVELSDGSAATVSVQGPLTGTSGQLVADVEFPTDVAGVYTAEVWVVDAAGNPSNRLTAALTVRGSAALAGLALSDGALVPAFDSLQTDYAVTVPYEVAAVTVTPTLLETAATMSVNGTTLGSGETSSAIDLAVGENPIAIDVTSSDGALQAAYVVAVTRLADASLEALSYSAGSLDQIFQPAQLNYTGQVGLLRSTTTVTAVPTDPNASVRVNDVPVDTANTSPAISLEEGENTISVHVTGADGMARSTYAIEVTREAADAFAQRAYVKASNTDENDQFGHAVALWGDTLAIGAFRESSTSTGIDGDQSSNTGWESGAVYVFVRDSAGIWSQQAYIKASNAGLYDWFGYSLDLSEDTLVVGAKGEWSAATGIGGDESNDDAMYAGAVYVFVRDAAGLWSQQAYIKASNAEADDEFGHAVALSGDTLAVGARAEASAATGIDGDESNNSALSSGAVYVYERDAAGAWTQQAYIKASNSGAGDWFGAALSLDGDMLAVGAPREASAAVGVGGSETDDSMPSAGAVYLFARAAGVWTQQAYVKASNTGAGHAFGRALALNGDTLAVGAPGEDGAGTGVDADPADRGAAEAGAVYVFRRAAAGPWAQTQYIKATNAEAGDAFGTSVALAADALAVGAAREASAAVGVGGDQADNSAAAAGAAYLFTRDATGDWSQAAYLKASNTFQSSAFGWSVAIADDSVAAGAISEDSGATGIDGDQLVFSELDSGAVYVFD